MRILIALVVLVVSGCMKHAVREPKPEDPSKAEKSEVQLLEERLGV